MSRTQVNKYIDDSITNELNYQNTAAVVRRVFKRISKDYFNLDSDTLPIEKVQGLTDLLSNFARFDKINKDISGVPDRDLIANNDAWSWLISYLRVNDAKGKYWQNLVFNDGNPKTIQQAIDESYNAIVDGAPDALNTLREIAQQIAADQQGAAAILAAITELKSGKVNVTDVANNLTTSAPGKVLDARQGKVLDEKIDGLIPLAGTVAGKPVRGDLELHSAPFGQASVALQWENDQEQLTARVSSSPLGLEMSGVNVFVNAYSQGNVTISSGGVLVSFSGAERRVYFDAYPVLTSLAANAYELYKAATLANKFIFLTRNLAEELFALKGEVGGGEVDLSNYLTYSGTTPAKPLNGDLSFGIGRRILFADGFNIFKNGNFLRAAGDSIVLAAGIDGGIQCTVNGVPALVIVGTSKLIEFYYFPVLKQIVANTNQLYETATQNNKDIFLTRWLAEKLFALKGEVTGGPGQPTDLSNYYTRSETNTLVDAQKNRLDLLLQGANPIIDTFLEAYTSWAQNNQQILNVLAVISEAATAANKLVSASEAIPITGTQEGNLVSGPIEFRSNVGLRWPNGSLSASSISMTARCHLLRFISDDLGTTKGSIQFIAGSKIGFDVNASIDRINFFTFPRIEYIANTGNYALYKEATRLDKQIFVTRELAEELFLESANRGADVAFPKSFKFSTNGERNVPLTGDVQQVDSVVVESGPDQILLFEADNDFSVQGAELVFSSPLPVGATLFYRALYGSEQAAVVVTKLSIKIGTQPAQQDAISVATEWQYPFSQTLENTAGAGAVDLAGHYIVLPRAARGEIAFSSILKNCTANGFYQVYIKRWRPDNTSVLEYIALSPAVDVSGSSGVVFAMLSGSVPVSVQAGEKLGLYIYAAQGGNLRGDSQFSTLSFTEF